MSAVLRIDRAMAKLHELGYRSFRQEVTSATTVRYLDFATAASEIGIMKYFDLDDLALYNTSGVSRIACVRREIDALWWANCATEAAYKGTNLRDVLREWCDGLGIQHS